MIPIHVSQNAIERYIDHTGARTEEEARAALSCPAVAVAGAFGARVVKLGCGRAVLALAEDGVTVVTFTSLARFPLQLCPQDIGGPPPISVDRDWPGPGRPSEARA